MATSRPKVLIMMSTYNGELYIEEQLESILAQEEIEVHTIIRDDGSKDLTLEILSRYAQKEPSKFTVLYESNVGVKKSFFDLIKHAGKEYDYYAFCDQDDVWLPKKMISAVNNIRSFDNSELPMLYCSSTQMVDQDLLPMKIWPEQPSKELSLYNALIENTCVGCTIVLNTKGFELIRSRIPSQIDKIIMHDWWMYLCISAFGRVFFDPSPGILYRQHQSNVLGGASDSLVVKWKKRFERFIKGQNHFILTQQAEEFRRIFKDQLEQQQSMQLEHFIKYSKDSLLKRVVYVFETSLYRQSNIDNLIFKFIFIAGKV